MSKYLVSTIIFIVLGSFFLQASFSSAQDQNVTYRFGAGTTLLNKIFHRNYFKIILQTIHKLTYV